jgi:hypothetical protein
VSGLTQSTPLCIASLTFMANLRCWSLAALAECSGSPPLLDYRADRVLWHEGLKVP